MGKKRVLILGIALLAAGLGINNLRLSEGGMRNVLSRTYWSAHLAGTDLYQPKGAVLKHGNRNVPEVALTFDDGPHPESLEKILATLKSAGVHATFFLVGKQIDEHPSWALRILDEGHEVGNHTQNHLRLTDLTDQLAIAEILDCESAFEKATGSTTYLLRPPGMRFDSRILRLTEGLGKTTIGWTDAAKDFEALDNRIRDLTRQELSDRVTSHIENGSIVLLHDTLETAAALPQIIAILKARGYRLVTIPEMLSHLPRQVLVRSNGKRRNSQGTRIAPPRDVVSADPMEERDEAMPFGGGNQA